MADLKITIGTDEKEVTFIPVYTRGIDKKFNAILFKDVNTNTNSKGETDFSINPSNMQEANDYLVEALTNLNNKEIEQMAISDYNEILEMANKLKTPSK